MADPNWIIIGVSGVTCGGKTTLSNRLKDTLSPVYVFHQDTYFYPDHSPNHVKVDGIDHNNYDILSALDMKKMHEDVMATLKGDEDKAHSFCKGAEGKITVAGKKFLILEGFTLLNYEPLFNLCNLRYYFILDYDECVRRRSYRVYDPPDVPGYFEKCVWPEHLVYRSQLEAKQGVTVIDATLSNNEVYTKVLDDISALSVQI